MTYNKKDWVTGEVINAPDLNNIEQGIKSNEDTITNVQNSIPTSTSQLTNDSGFLTSLPDTVVTTNTEQSITAKKPFSDIAVNRIMFGNNAFVEKLGDNVRLGYYYASRAVNINAPDDKGSIYVQGRQMSVGGWIINSVNAQSQTVNGLTTSNKTLVGAINEVKSSIPSIVHLTQSEYDALSTKDANTLYIITG